MTIKLKATLLCAKPGPCWKIEPADGSWLDPAGTIYAAADSPEAAIAQAHALIARHEAEGETFKLIRRKVAS